MVSKSLQINILLLTRGILLSGDVQSDTNVVLSLAEHAEVIGCDSV